MCSILSFEINYTICCCFLFVCLKLLSAVFQKSHTHTQTTAQQQPLNKHSITHNSNINSTHTYNSRFSVFYFFYFLFGFRVMDLRFGCGNRVGRMFRVMLCGYGYVVWDGDGYGFGKIKNYLDSVFWFKIC